MSYHPYGHPQQQQQAYLQKHQQQQPAQPAAYYQQPDQQQQQQQQAPYGQQQGSRYQPQYLETTSYPPPSSGPESGSNAGFSGSAYGGGSGPSSTTVSPSASGPAYVPRYEPLASSATLAPPAPLVASAGSIVDSHAGGAGGAAGGPQPWLQPQLYHSSSSSPVHQPQQAYPAAAGPSSGSSYPTQHLPYQPQPYHSQQQQQQTFGYAPSSTTAAAAAPPTVAVAPPLPLSAAAPAPEKARGGGGGSEGAKKAPIHPVKNACLNCRSRKMKCTGEQPVCLNCAKKAITCEYVKSKRGGARKRKAPTVVAGVGIPGQGRSASSATATATVVEDPLALFLKRMTDLAAFKASADPSLDLLSLTASSSTNGKGSDEAPVLREYRTVREVVDAYQAIIYPYLPILPPPEVVAVDRLVDYLTAPGGPSASSSAFFLNDGSPGSMTDASVASPPDYSSNNAGGFRPSSLALAFLAILVLHPPASDPDPQSARSKHLRRQASEAFARRSLAEVDEALDRAGQAEMNGEEEGVELQTVQTLIVMVTWEFAQKGNMVKMRLRQGHALQLAMDLNLHRSDAALRLSPDQEWTRDMRRRTWWIAFGQLCQASVMSGIPPSVAPFDTRITAEFPACRIDPELWPNQMGAIRHIARTFQLIIQADFPQAAAPDAVPGSSLVPSGPFPDDASAEADRLAAVHGEMVALDRKVLLSLRALEKKAVQEVKKGMGPEEHMAHNFQTSTLMSLSTCEIALHRRVAFPEVAFFSRKLCGLPSLNARSGQFGSDPNGGGRQPISPAQLVETARVTPIAPSSTGSSFAPLPSLPADSSPQAVIDGVWGSSEPDGPLLPVAGWTPPAAAGPHEPVEHYATAGFVPPTVGCVEASAYSAPAFSANGGGYPAANFASGTAAAVPPSPWYANDAGAASLVFHADINPYGGLLVGSGVATGSFNPVSVDAWSTLQPTPVPASSTSMFETVDRYALNMPDMPAYFGSFPDLLGGQPAQQQQQAFAQTYSFSTVPPVPTSLDPQQVYGSNLLSQLTPPASQPSRSNPASVHSASPSQRSTTSSFAPLASVTPKASSPARPWGLDGRLKPTSHLISSGSSSQAVTTLSRLSPAERLSIEGEEIGELLRASDVPDGPFPPGLSLERCSAAAHSIVRLETLQRTAAFTMLDGPARALPFCACGLMASAYCFLLLALAIQAGESFDPRALESKQAELEGLYTNVRIILAGLAKYAEVWDGLSNLAQEVKAALDAAISLSTDLQQQRLTAMDDSDEGEDDDDDDGMSAGSDLDGYVARPRDDPLAAILGWQG